MPSSTRKARLFSLAVCLIAMPGLVFATAGSAAADPTSPQPVPVPDWANTATPDTALSPALRAAQGDVTVSVTLSAEALAATVPEGATKEKSLPSAASQQAQTAVVVSQQDQVIAQALALGAKALGRVSKAANIVAMSIPSAKLTELAAIPGVVSVKPVAKYETHEDAGGSGSLAQAAEYLEATSVRDAGYDGTGVRIAVLDSGADYTHSNLGGPGTLDAYEACYLGDTGTAYNEAPVGDCAALFGPDAPKIKGGYDFVGEDWPNTPEAPDPNPIDFEGHGTHVADIAAGRSADGTHEGIAPGASVYSLKVCSAVATSCSGIALLQAVDWALDPNGDGDLSDAVDIVNLSLGSAYGQEQDDLTVAIDNLVRAGVVAVVSAGNSADRPFIVGSPSTAERAISVAQTALPDDVLFTVAVDSPEIPGLTGNAVRNAHAQSWAPLPSTTITAPLAQPVGDLLGCLPEDFSAFPAGAVALIARGTCAASVKAQNAEAAGASAVIIWNNVPGDPPDFSFGGGAPVTIPTLTISLASGTLLSDAVTAGPVEVTLDPSATTSLANTTVGTSSRGVSVSGLRAKPDIGAPGAWLSAEVGTGSEQTNFGGTSGAAPVITGAAALVLDRYPYLPPAVVKARLLNGASMDNGTPDADGNLYATPISRIGAGEVRIAPSVNANGVLGKAKGYGGGNIGLGLPHLTGTKTYTVQLAIGNQGSKAQTYAIAPTFRDPADAATGAVTVSAPSSVRVSGRSIAPLTVKVTIDPSKLSAWPFTHAAGYTGDGAALNGPEFDGYLTATSATETLHLGWTVLPEKSAQVTAPGSVKLRNGQGALTLSNASTVSDGAADVFALTGTSPKEPKPGPGEPGSAGSNLALIDLAAVGVRDDIPTGIIQFAIAGQQRQTTPLYPAGYEVDIDTNRDGSFDYAVFQQEAVGFGLSGQSLVYVQDLVSGDGAAYYYNDANFDSATTVFSAPLGALGLSQGSTFDYSVIAYDNYFTGLVTDAIEGQTWTVGSAQYALNDSLVVPAGDALTVNVTKNADAGPSTQTGFLFLYGDAAKKDAQAVRVTGN